MFGILGNIFGGGSKTSVTTESSQDIDVESNVTSEVTVNNAIDMTGFATGMKEAAELTATATRDAAATGAAAAERIAASVASTLRGIVGEGREAAAQSAADNRKALIEYGQAATAILALAAAAFALWKGGNVRVQL